MTRKRAREVAAHPKRCKKEETNCRQETDGRSQGCRNPACRTPERVEQNGYQSRGA